MRFFAIIPLLLSTLAVATPTPAARDYSSTCISPSAATALVSGFASLLTHYNNATANQILASDFTDTSDSINFIAGIPLGSVTFPSKLAFELGQSSQPAIGLQVLAIDAITCNVVVWRWVAELGADPVKGINVMYVTNPGKSDCGVQGGWQIEKNFSEFNSGAWIVDIGGTCKSPLAKS